MQFENYSNFEIEQAIGKVFISERSCQVSFILLLGQVYHRSLYLDAGYSSVMNYCREKFNLSEYSDPGNLTILCRGHNQYQGALHFGWEKMRRA